MEKRMNIWEFLKERLSGYGDNTAFVCETETVSYSQLMALVECNQSRSRDFAVVKDGSKLEQAIAILTNLRQDNIVVPLNSAYGESYCIGIEDELAKYDAGEIDIDIALILFTSGSTGKPKGVMLSHENIISNILAIESYFNVDSCDSILIARPLMHCAVLIGELLYSLYKGLAIHLYDESFMPQRIAKYAIEQGITTIGCTPTMLNLLAAVLVKSERFTLKNIVVSGEVLSSDAAMSLGKAFPDMHFYSVYGLTEASPRVSALLPENFRSKPGSIGKPLAGIEMKLTDEKKCETEDGCYGRLLVKSPGVMRGYLGNEELSKAKLIDGWLDTGDIARRDLDGYCYILGRADNMIIRAGVNIYPEEMEALLKKDKRVKEALFYAKEHSYLGKQLCLTIAADISKDEALKICKELLPTFAQPQQIEFVDNIVKTASGKMKRNACTKTLGERYSDWKREMVKKGLL